MKAQVEKLTNKNIKAVYLKDRESRKTDDKTSEKVLQTIESGHYDLIFASPETLLQSNRDTVMKLARKGCLKVIFVDEAHCIKIVSTILFQCNCRSINIEPCNCRS